MPVFVPLSFKRTPGCRYTTDSGMHRTYQSYRAHIPDPTLADDHPDSKAITYRISTSPWYKGTVVMLCQREPWEGISVYTTNFYKAPDHATAIRAVSHHANNRHLALQDCIDLHTDWRDPARPANSGW